MQSTSLAKSMQEAIEHAEGGRLLEASVLFKSLMEQYPEDPALHYNAGILLSQLGEHITAADSFLKACELMPQEKTFLLRASLECLVVGGAQSGSADFMAWDVAYLLKSEKLLESYLDKNTDPELSEILQKIRNHMQKNRLAFRFMEGDLDYCRRSLTRKKDLTALDHRIMGFLNLLDSGEYLHQTGQFGVILKSDLPSERRQGFLERIRNWVLGK